VTAFQTAMTGTASPKTSMSRMEAASADARPRYTPWRDVINKAYAYARQELVATRYTPWREVINKAHDAKQEQQRNASETKEKWQCHKTKSKSAIPTDQMTATSLLSDNGSSVMEIRKQCDDRLHAKRSERSDVRLIVVEKGCGAVLSEGGVAIAQTRNARIIGMIDWMKEDWKDARKPNGPGYNDMHLKNQDKNPERDTEAVARHAKAAKSQAREEQQCHKTISTMSAPTDDHFPPLSIVKHTLNCGSTATLGNPVVQSVVSRQPIMYLSCMNEAPQPMDGVKIPGLLLGRPPDSFSLFRFHQVVGHGVRCMSLVSNGIDLPTLCLGRL